MNIDTLTLKMFLATAETGSFTRAAEKTFRTQSALSQRIQQLEEMLGKTLIKRDKKITLTNEGEAFFKYAKKIVKLETEMFEYFQTPNLSGEFKFGLPEDFVSVFIQPVLKEFSDIHPLISLNIECDLTLNLFERFHRGEFDLVLLKIQEGNYVTESGVDMWEEKLVWVSNQNQIELNQEPLSLVLSPKPCVYRTTVLQVLEENHIPWRISFTSQSYAAKMSAVKAGLGITILPQNMVPADFYILDNDLLPSLPLTHALLLKKTDDNEVVNCLESFILEKLAITR